MVHSLRSFPFNSFIIVIYDQQPIQTIPYLGQGAVADRIIVVLSIGYRSYVTIIKELSGNERSE